MSKYWTKDTEEQILSFNNETDLVKRNTLFNEKIYPVFHKLVECIFKTYKIIYIDDDIEFCSISYLSK